MHTKTTEQSVVTVVWFPARTSSQEGGSGVSTVWGCDALQSHRLDECICTVRFWAFVRISDMDFSTRKNDGEFSVRARNGRYFASV